MQSLERLLGVLEVLAGANKEGLRATDVMHEIGLSMPTTLRLLEALCQSGLVVLNRRRFVLGPKLVFLGHSAARTFSIERIAHPSIEWLAATTGDTAYFGMRDGTRSVCVIRVLGAYPIKTSTIEVGDRRALGVGGGSLALLAAHSAEEIEELLAVNEKDIAQFPGMTIDRVRREAQEAQRVGYTYAEGHVTPGVHAVGVAVRDPFGNPVGSVTTAAIASRFVDNRKEEVIDATRKAARRIEQDLAGEKRKG